MNVQIKMVVALIVLTMCGISCTQEKPAATAGAAPAAPKAVAPAAPVLAASGDWKWTIDPMGGQAIDQSAKLVQDGEKLTGTFTDGFDGASFEIKDGKVSKDGQVSFSVARNVGGMGDMTLKFGGKLDGDTIKGKVDFSMGDQPMSSDWVAKRVKS